MVWDLGIYSINNGESIWKWEEMEVVIMENYFWGRKVNREEWCFWGRYGRKGKRKCKGEGSNNFVEIKGGKIK